jgi:hypothetical protein
LDYFSGSPPPYRYHRMFVSKNALTALMHLFPAHQLIHGTVALRRMHLGLANQIVGKTQGNVSRRHDLRVTHKCVNMPANYFLRDAGGTIPFAR